MKCVPGKAVFSTEMLLSLRQSRKEPMEEFYGIKGREFTNG